MKASSCLRRARTILLENDWSQCASARDEEGEPCSVFSDDALGFSALGALWKVGGHPDGEAERLLELSLLGVWKGSGVEEYNDAPSRTKDQILRLYDRAIKLAKSDEHERSLDG